MKIKKILTAVALLSVCLTAKANYTIEFTTYDGADGPLFPLHAAFDVGGVIALGPGFMGQLYVGATAGTLAPIGTPQVFGVPNAPDGHIGIGEIAITDPSLNVNSAAFYRVRAWSVGSSSYEAALATPGAHVGESAATAITLGGSLPAPSLPVTATANLHPSFSLSVVPVIIPEPSVLALGLLGGAALMFRRRK